MLCSTVSFSIPATAGAGTVSVRPNPDPEHSGDVLVFEALPGERNVVSARVLSRDEEWEITDTGAVIAAGAPCRAVSAHTVSCPKRADRYYESLGVGLGDLDDHFDATSPAFGNFEALGRVLVDGGPGDDELVGGVAFNTLAGGDGNDLLVARGEGDSHWLDGGPGNDRLLGGPSFDQLDGGGGRDEIFGGGGDDRITDGDSDEATGDAGPGPDLLDGGDDGCCSAFGGGDQVSYSGRSEPVRVDLSDKGPTDGEAGEADTIVRVESVEGGSGADRLLGNHRTNTLIGGAGRDRLKGRGGTDKLFPGEFSPSTLRPPAEGDRVSCGSGLREPVWSPDHTTFVPHDCERVTWWTNDYDPYPKRRAGGLEYTVACPVIETDGLPLPPCRGRARLSLPPGHDRTLAATAMPLGRWGGRHLVIPLTARGRRVAATGRKVLAIVHFHWYMPATRWFPSSSRDYSWMIKLRLPR